MPFKQAKDVIKTEVKLAIPDFTKPFYLYTGASNIQLGTTLVQDWKDLGFYTRKLSNTQINCTVSEKELLGIVYKSLEPTVQETTKLKNDVVAIITRKLPSKSRQWCRGRPLQIRSNK